MQADLLQESELETLRSNVAAYLQQLTNRFSADCHVDMEDLLKRAGISSHLEAACCKSIGQLGWRRFYLTTLRKKSIP